MAQIALPVGFWSLPDPRATGRSTVNCFAEISPYGAAQLTAAADGKQKLPPAYLRRAPGTSLLVDDGSSNPVRGMWMMQGVLYTVIGPTLYSSTNGSALTTIGTGITGTGFVRMTDNTACLVVLVPGTKLCWTYCPEGGGFQQLTAAGFTQYGAIDCWFCDSYIVFLALNGREFFNDDGQEISGQSQITFNGGAVFGRELATDLYIGMCVDHREVTLFGAENSDGYANAGNPTGSPFDSAPGSYMAIGMHPDAGYTAAIQNQSVFWLANDRTVRNRVALSQFPNRVSNHAVETVLADANLAGCYAFAYSLGGHMFYALTLPAQPLTLVYDVTTGEWYQASSLINGSWTYWRPLCSINAFGQQLVGDTYAGQIGTLDFNTFTEFGNPLLAKFRTQSVYSNHDRIVHRRLEAIVTAGESTSLTAGAYLTCKVSDDSGRTWRALPMRSLGASGQYTTRATWFNLGMSRDRVYEFELSDPTEYFAVDLQAEVQGGRW